MKALTLMMWLCLNAIPAFAQSAAAVSTSACPSTVSCLHAAPAPSIGVGLPAFLGVGAVLLGVMVWKRRRQ